MSPSDAKANAGAEAARRLYRGRSGSAYHEIKRALDPGALEWVLRLRAEKFQPWVRDTDTVFELGVGSGWNLARLKCARRIGCDPATFLADRVRALGIEFHEDSCDIPDAAADVALCHQTLEHLLDPMAALNELSRTLKPGGRLVLHVPWEVERRYARFDPDEPNHHFYNWNVQNLGNFVSVLNWRIDVIRLRFYGYDRFAANLAARLKLGERGFRLLRRLLIRLRPLREVELVAHRGEAPDGHSIRDSHHDSS